DENTSDSDINNEELYCDENTSDSDNNENCHNNLDIEQDEIVQLKEWIISCRIPHSHSDKLLKILRRRVLPTLPTCTKTFLQSTSAKYLLQNMEDTDNSIGEFTYLGIAQGLRNCVNVDLHINHELHLQFNIDGMKPYKSSNRTLWPILCKVHFELNIYKPFTVALYSRTHKPKNRDQYLNKFINELNKLLCEGLIIGETQVSIKIKSFICDTPARSYLKCVKGHMSFNGCEKCHVKGEKHENTVVFLNTHCDKRTDEEFRTFSDVNHHTFLLYCGPVVLKNILDDFKYNHFLLLRIAYRLLHTKVNIAFLEHAREYLNTFISVAKDLYRKQFVTINVHNLCHTVDDVENMNCSINLINAYNFESHLGQIKNILRSPYRTLSQFYRREHEKILHTRKVVSLPKKQEIISKRSEQDILQIKYEQYLLTSKCPNNQATR
ncbi:hypothetical protein X777_08139, partial [Ooceraea biroi]